MGCSLKITSILVLLSFAHILKATKVSLRLITVSLYVLDVYNEESGNQKSLSYINNHRASTRNSGKRTFLVRASNLWNNVPPSIRTELDNLTLYHFKTNVIASSF